MTPYSPANTYHPTVSTFDIDTLVLGGPTGPDNVPVKELADNVHYVFKRLGKFLDVNFLFSSGDAIGPDDKGKLNLIDIGNNGFIELADVGDFEVGDIVKIKCKLPPGKACEVRLAAGNIMYDGGTLVSKLYLCDGETALLVPVGSFWLLVERPEGYERLGQDALVRVQPRNSVIAQGQVANYADYPRIQEMLTANPALVVSEAIWLADAVANRGYFASVSGTQFRFPDMRAMMHRGLDLGRGIRLGTSASEAGSYETDAVGPHTHVTNFPQVQNNASGVPVGVTDGPTGGPAGGRNYTSQANSGIETRPKNVGLIPIIYF